MTRLIDADELKNHKFVGSIIANGTYQLGWNDCIDAIIDNAPPVERTHGEWEKVEEPFGWGYISCCECSICKNSWVLDECSFEELKDDFKYCPNCGADMREREGSANV